MAATRTEISAGAALRFFAKSNITVQEAKAVKEKSEDGKVREGYETTKASLAEKHVTGAAEYADRVVITTIDGKRHEAKK